MTSIKSVTPCYSEVNYSQRVEVVLTNGQQFTLLVDGGTGHITLLSDTPHALGAKFRPFSPEDKGPCGQLINVEMYGVPYGD